MLCKYSNHVSALLLNGLRDYGTATWEGGNSDCDHIDNEKLAERLRQKKSMIAVGEKIDGSTRTRIHDEELGKEWQYKNTCKKCGAKRIDKQLGLEETPEEYVNKLADVFDKVKRVLKPDGTLFLNLGDSYNGSGGAGGDYNEGGCKEGQPKYPGRKIETLKPKDLIGIPWSVAFELRKRGWWLRQDIIWSKGNPMPESVTDRCTKSHEYIFLLSKSAKYYYDYGAIKEDCSAENIKDFKNRKTMNNKSGGKGSYEDARPDLCRNREDYMPSDFKRNKRSVWTVNTEPCKEAHFAVFPPKLIVDMTKAGSPENGIVLDCFMGAGTTGIVARKLNRNFIGIELNQKYIDIAEKRMYNELGMFK